MDRCGGRGWRGVELDLSGGWEIQFEDFLGDDAGAVEGVVEPEVGGEGMVSRSGDDAIFEGVAGSETEDADGFYADVVVSGGVEYSGIGIVGDGAGEDVSGTAAWVDDVDHGDFNGLEGAVVIKVETGELLDAEFVVDVDAGVDFLAGIAAGFEAVVGFEEFDLHGVFWFLGRS